VPVLSDALAYLACDIVDEFPGGDHTIVLGKVVELGIPRRRQEPLIFFEGSFGALEEELRAVYSIWTVDQATVSGLRTLRLDEG